LKTFSSQGQVYGVHLTAILQKLILINHKMLFIFEYPCAFSPPIRMQFQLSLRKGQKSLAITHSIDDFLKPPQPLHIRLFLESCQIN